MKPFVSLLSAFVIAITAAQAHARTVDIAALGASGDGATDATAHFEEALASLGGEAGTIEINGGQFLVNSITFPDTVGLHFRNGGQLVVAEGETVTIDGPIDAHTVQIFGGDGSVTGSPDALQVLPQWFGAKGDGVHDDARAIQQAADFAANATGRMLFIPEGEYLFHSNLSFRCHVECRGLFIKSMEINEDRTEFSNDLFLPTHHPYTDAQIMFVPDHAAVALDASAFFGIAEGDMELPIYREVPLADGSGTIDLAEGGTLRFYSTDFFSSRQVRKGAHFYDRNDITQLVSGRGNVFPEFAFSYAAPPRAQAWDAETEYTKGDYCTHEGAVFKATWPSGPGSGYTHRHFGAIEIGPAPPNPGAGTTSHNFEYENGTADSITIWRRVETEVWYRPKDTPLTVNGLRMEVRLEGHEGLVKRVSAGAMAVTRSNMVFNKLEISVRDREATMSRLLSSAHCVNNEFNNGYFSGATSAHLGYNILNSNVANFRYNDCISTNSRKGMDGRHGKNITVSGGFYNVIDDHYGRNYTIRNVTLSGESVFVPNDSTPNADLQNWRFGSRGAMNFNGANFHLEHITVIGGRGGILAARSDVGDLYGTITLRDVTVRGNEGNVTLFQHSVSPSFDFASRVGVPSQLIIENARMENPGKFELRLGQGFDGRGGYGPVHVRNAVPIGNVHTTSRELSFTECTLVASHFDASNDARVNFRHCVFEGEISGLDPSAIGIATGSLVRSGEAAPFPETE